MTLSSVPLSSEQLDRKIQAVFGEQAIDKRRLPMSQLTKQGIPAYVAEWILDTLAPGYGELTSEEADKVRQWAVRYIPSPSDANQIKNRLLNGELVKILTLLEVDVILTERDQKRVANLRLLQMLKIVISDGLVEKYPDLLDEGMWGVVEIINDPAVGPSVVGFKPMQASIAIDLYKGARKEFTLDEWRSMLLTSMGYQPDAFTTEEQSVMLCRLLPLVEKNLHVIELAPKGTGKSYVFENISPHIRLISGGNVSPAVLFVNNANDRWGILERFSVVVLDEVQTLKFEQKDEIVGGLKGYLANDRLTRGGKHETSSDCSLVLLANILLDEFQRPVKSPIIKDLPLFLQETAIIDRFKGIIPGWRINKLSPSSFAQGVGLKSDFFGDAMLALRGDLEINQFVKRKIGFNPKKSYTRNTESINALASGMMKLLFPHGVVSDEDFDRYCVQPAVTLRQLIWDQLYTLDAEYRQYDRVLRYDIK